MGELEGPKLTLDAGAWLSLIGLVQAPRSSPKYGGRGAADDSAAGLRRFLSSKDLQRCRRPLAELARKISALPGGGRVAESLH